MEIRKIIAPLGVGMGASLSYWLVLPGLDFLLTIIFMIVMIMMVIERQHPLALAAVISGGIIGLIPGLALAPVSVFLPNWLQVAVPPLVLGWMLNRGFGAGRSFTLAASLASMAILIIYQQYGPDMADFFEKMRLWFMGFNSSVSQAKGVDQATINASGDSISLIFYAIIHLLPGLLILLGLTQLFIAFILVDVYYTRRDSYFPGFGPYIYWKMPEKLLYSLALALAVRLVFNGVWQQVADNALLILIVLYSISGLSLMEYLLRKLQIPLYIKIFVYLGPIAVAAPVIGLFDSYFDYRKVRAHNLG